MDNINLITNMILPSNNDVQAYAKMATSTSARDSSFFKININGDTQFAAPRYRLSRAIESNTAASSATMAANRSVEIKYTLAGSNKVASPAIDLSRLSLYSTHNLISTNAAIGSSEDYVKSGGSSQSRYITRTVTVTITMRSVILVGFLWILTLVKDSLIRQYIQAAKIQTTLSSLLIKCRLTLLLLDHRISLAQTA
jgi:hypothetical protein